MIVGRISCYRNTLGLVDVAGKAGSVVFSAHRDSGHTYTEDNFLTFSGSHVNIGNAFRFSSQHQRSLICNCSVLSPKSGMFQCSDPGVYFFMLTVSTYEGKHCCLSIKKNGKTVASMKDSKVRYNAISERNEKWWSINYF